MFDKVAHNGRVHVMEGKIYSGLGANYSLTMSSEC